MKYIVVVDKNKEVLYIKREQIQYLFTYEGSVTIVLDNGKTCISEYDYIKESERIGIIKSKNE